jgi:hypothetical protein
MVGAEGRKRVQGHTVVGWLVGWLVSAEGRKRVSGSQSPGKENHKTQNDNNDNRNT